MSGDVQKVLPKLGDKRLALAGRQSHRTRKLTSIVNEKLKRKYKTYEKVVDKNAKSFEYKSWQNTMPIKDTMLRIRGAQKCLKKRRESVLLEEDPENKKFGMYDGISLDTMKYEIDKIHQDAHPRVRRLRKVERLLESGKHDGRLVNYDEIKVSLDAILNRPSLMRKNETKFGMEGFNAYMRPVSAHSSPNTFSFDKGSHKAKLRLPPLVVSRENSNLGAGFDRIKSMSLPTLFSDGRSRTFAFDAKFKRKFSTFRN
ncbi:uncharacterized protein LOC110456296 [Mizuhopecten yessoensis]|uniref:Uncharacterized protein n=1 Tax=Mizuhopecten yessoensis TaxID=6573 RepID=A0A210QBA0_MIZYE|nr:uncharacterized protein LOC110456296 [Mizuhopecten yessoensis]OWF46010.1 hypothetical protein KP79_PYT26268 [Mizuhopecten yessoensis]